MPFALQQPGPHGHLWRMSRWCRYSRASRTWPSTFCIHWGKNERCQGWGRGTPGSSWPRQVSHPRGSQRDHGMFLLLQMGPTLLKRSEPAQKSSASGPFQANVRGALPTGHALASRPHTPVATPEIPPPGPHPLWVSEIAKPLLPTLGLALPCH